MDKIKLIYKAIVLGFPGDPHTSTLLDIQTWIAQTYGQVPAPHWSFKEKIWAGYVYPMTYDPVVALKKIKSDSGCSSQEATRQLNSYIKFSFAASDDTGNSKFKTAEEALYWAIVKSFEIIKKLDK